MDTIGTRGSVLYKEVAEFTFINYWLHAVHCKNCWIKTTQKFRLK